MLTWDFYLRRILPVGLFMALTLLCGNLVYLYLTVSFIQMLKARPSICMLAAECFWSSASCYHPSFPQASRWQSNGHLLLVLE